MGWGRCATARQFGPGRRAASDGRPRRDARGGVGAGAAQLSVRLVALDARGWVFTVRHSYVPGLHLPGAPSYRRAALRRRRRAQAREEGGLVLAGPPALFMSTGTGAAGGATMWCSMSRGAWRRRVPRRRSRILSAGFHPPDALPDVTPATRDRLAEVLGAPSLERW